MAKYNAKKTMNFYRLLVESKAKGKRNSENYFKLNLQKLV
jgi:hypothetical protein